MYDGDEGQWNRDTLRKLVKYLRLQPEYEEAFLPMIRAETLELGERDLHNLSQSISAFLDQLGSLERKQVAIELTLNILIPNGYGSRERGVLRRLCTCFKLSWSWFATVETAICQTVLQAGRLSHSHERKKGSMARYAKIGAAAVGAGALLAVTG
jgi:hypothetical protein